MLIDTHCHLDAGAFDEDRLQIITAASKSSISNIIVPAVSCDNFDALIALNHTHAHIQYALGIHPMFLDQTTEQSLTILASYLEKHHPVAIGEIGLDYFVNQRNLSADDKSKQAYYFTEQLKLAAQHHLPVILHVRRAIDDVLKYLRKHSVVGGIAHAFNGSMQQAEQFIALGFKLGFGGAMTYPRALKIRALAKTLPLSSIVLETDAPDMSPAWLPARGRNSPLELIKIAEVLAEIRGVDVGEIARITSANARAVLPKIPSLCT